MANRMILNETAWFGRGAVGALTDEVKRRGYQKALHVSRWGNGRGRLLFTWIVLLGAAVAALFANDGAALILTPIIISMLQVSNSKWRPFPV